jgi:mannonate dehydratase
MIKLGFGLYRHALTPEYYKFARQCGATHLIIHLVDYFGSRQDGSNQPVGDKFGWGMAVKDDDIWSVASLKKIKREVEAEGLSWYGIENFNPCDWHDILLDGPRKAAQMDRLKEIIRNMGEAGIPVMGYNFSLAGVCGRTEGPYARGGGISVGMEGEATQNPVPVGMVWNMQYAPQLGPGYLPPCSHEELWNRVAWFLNELLPVAEAAGVKLAAHPDDPPVPVLRSTPRLVYQPDMYDKLAAIRPSAFNCFEYCLGTISEMTEGNVYEYTRKHALEQKLAYIHLRNVKGKAPDYRETFIDEGDLDIKRIIRILEEVNYDGVIIPDHCPQMSCHAPWHAGMAFAMGYLKALIN